jgi:hypothetical protein
MKIEEAEKAIKEAGGDWKVFEQWHCGQTYGINPDGTTNIYEYDVERFIRYKCNPDKEPMCDFD